jgi:hypothetical protein
MGIFIRIDAFPVQRSILIRATGGLARADKGLLPSPALANAANRSLISTCAASSQRVRKETIAPTMIPTPESHAAVFAHQRVSSCNFSARFLAALSCSASQVSTSPRGSAHQMRPVHRHLFASCEVSISPDSLPRASQIAGNKLHPDRVCCGGRYRRVIAETGLGVLFGGLQKRTRRANRDHANHTISRRRKV